MPRLFDISAEFSQLFDQYDNIQEMEFDCNDNGEPVDAEGNVIDPETFRADMLQAWFDTLEGIEGEFETKAENVAQYIKSLKAMEADIKEEERKLNRRRKTYERKIENMTTYLKNCMTMMNLKKVETPKAKISIKNNAPSLVINDEGKFIDMLQDNGRDDLLRYTAPAIDKTAVKNLIKSGEQFEGACLEASQSLIIG